MSPASAFVSALRISLVQVMRNADSFALRLLQRTEYALQQSLASDFDDSSVKSKTVNHVSLSILKQHRARLIDSFPRYLLESLILSARQPVGQTSDTGMLPLATVADSVNQQLRFEQKLVSLLAPQLELALADLDALMSGAQGLQWVQPQSNLLRLENYVRALGQSISAVQATAEVMECWQHFMGLQLGGLLTSEYARTIQLLRRNGVSPARYPEGGSDSPQPTQPLLTLRMLQELASDLRWMDEVRLTIPMVSSQFMVDGWEETKLQPSGSPSTVSMPSPAATGQTQWAASPTTLSQLQPQPQMLTKLGDVQNTTTLSSLSSQASVRRLRTLQRMMSHMTADTRLLPRVKAVLRLLEPALEQVAQSDQAFFDDSTHPARQLLDELTARSLWFSGESSPGYLNFMEVAEQAAQALAGQSPVDASAFAQALQQMRQQWPEQESLSAMGAMGSVGATSGVSAADAGQSTQGMMSSALGLVERHTAMVTQQASSEEVSLSQIIRSLPGAREAPEDIVDFVCGPWAEVIFAAQQKDTSGAERDPGGYLALVPSLLWSVSPQAAQDTGRLVAIAPKLQRRLARGLHSVGRSEVEIAALAARIGSLHQHYLDAAQAEVMPRPDLFAPTVLLEVPADSVEGENPPECAKAAEAVSTTIFANIEHSSSDCSAGGAGKPLVTSVAMDGEWPVGALVELSNERKRLKTRLTWVSPQQSLFLFTADDGSTQSMTRRMRDKLLATGQLTRLDLLA